MSNDEGGLGAAAGSGPAAGSGAAPAAGSGAAPAAARLRVVVADDQTAVREGLVMILQLSSGLEVVGAAADGAEAVALAAELAPDVVLMDLRMPNLDGVEATRRVRAASPSSQVVVLTTYADDESVLEALAAGAISYLTKDAGREDIRRAIEAAASGQTVLDAAAHDRLLAALHRTQRPPAGTAAGLPAPPPADSTAAEDGARRPVSAALPDGLTPREGEVLALIAEGLSNKEIAGRLYLSEVTVKTHINRIFAKTGSTSRAQAIVHARRIGIGG